MDVVQNEWQDKEVECFKDPMNSNNFLNIFEPIVAYLFVCIWLLLKKGQTTPEAMSECGCMREFDHASDKIN